MAINQFSSVLLDVHCRLLGGGVVGSSSTESKLVVQHEVWFAGVLGISILFFSLFNICFRVSGMFSPTDDDVQFPVLAGSLGGS